MKLDLLARDGAVEVLRQLCTGEARFKELNRLVPNIRTLSRRLKELQKEELIQRAGIHYRITERGFGAALKIAELERETDRGGVHPDPEEIAKVRCGWLRISLERLTELFLGEFDETLVSLILYGSAVKASFHPGRSDIDLLYVVEDGAGDPWPREGKVFRDFQSTWEYKACDHYFKTRGFHGYPEVTAISLERNHAKRFQPIYLDMLSHRAVLYDKDGFFQDLMEKLEKELKTIGTIRIEHPDGTYGWLLKPDITPGELIEINLGWADGHQQGEG